MFDPSVRAFIQVVECGSFNAASEKLFISPTSVMNQINKLEAHVGTKLLERDRTGTVPTAAGRSYYESMRKLVAQEQLAVDKALRQASDDQVIVRVGNSYLNPCAPVFEAWDHLRQQNNHNHSGGGSVRYRFSIVSFDDESSLDSLYNRLGKDIDLLPGIIDGHLLHEDVLSVPLFRSRMCILVPEGHPLTRKTRFSLDDLHGQDVLAAPAGVVTAVDEVRQWMFQHHPKIRFRLPDTDTSGLNAFGFSATSGMPILTHEYWSRAYPGFVKLPIDWNFFQPYGLLYSASADPRIHDLARMLAKSADAFVS